MPPIAPIEPFFWHQPLRYMRWAARERPALFWSCVVGGAGPLIVVAAPPLRARFFNDYRPPPIPSTYPIPAGPRKIPSGYEDP
ncbi:uncharacterized protein PV09_07899 [Verruconis gallopava]|uniref:NADH-ubiquinone oxidoreductase 9.5 kDa subunit n=1 Tax=Verruconis gallopava TaxID=253628 RepID=A0A0D2AN58_9PEZI|nr:uncharacterized protein PV09_07899 [Verruconis gallopava]KIW00544.1 hypothetical protein PV09_07899 [Verruconis gallopava]